jgi:hypothetical protein
VWLEIRRGEGNLQNLGWMQWFPLLLEQDKQARIYYNLAWLAINDMTTLLYWGRMWIA